jgi:transcriptional regulator with XRE-family HTH domain
VFEIDKDRLGSFISELRKEKEYTQKELAERLFISDKAISKWETGASIPDTTLLIPLADLLGVTVTELLTYQRIEPTTPIGPEQVEDILKTAITQTATEQVNTINNKRQWCMAYIFSLLLCCAELVFLYTKGYMDSILLTYVGLSVFFGGYFCFFIKTKLPTFYDENRINFYSDGAFKMNMPGVAFNNSNWPKIIQTLRIWSVVSIIGYPILSYIMKAFLPEAIQIFGYYVCLFLFLGGLFFPVYITAKKYQ